MRIRERPGRRESAALLALAAVAALRVGLLGAAFPFFTNVDEHRHVDMVLKYARGYVPRPGLDAYEPGMGALLALHGSPEYHARPGERVARPAARLSDAARSRRIAASERLLHGGPNLEAFGPPGYYAVAGAWLALGRALGIDEHGAGFFWIRLPGAVCLGLLVWIGGALMRRIAPRDPVLRLGVPLLLAAFPQDVFHYVTNDALSPTIAGLGFAWIVALARQPDRGPLAWALAGGIAAAAVLVKYTNVALLGAYVATGVAVLARSRAGAERRRVAVRQASMWMAFGLPLGLWLLRNQLLFDSPTATATKVEWLGWGSRPLSEWSAHPFFTPSGIVTFVGELVSRFWRGEVVWNRAELAHPAVDTLYVLTSLLAVGLVAAGLIARRRAAGGLPEVAALATLGAAVATMVAFSLVFSFHETSNPPEHHPFFTHGRLIGGHCSRSRCSTCAGSAWRQRRCRSAWPHPPHSPRCSPCSSSRWPRS